jgi:PAS domain S-box-containing protein
VANLRNPSVGRNLLLLVLVPLGMTLLANVALIVFGLSIASLVVTGLGTILAATAVFTFGNRFIVQPITALTAAAKQISAGQFEVAMPVTNQRDEIGVLVGAFGQMITELQRKLTRETAMLQSALDCVIIIDHHGQIIEFNRAAEKTFGYSRPEALRRKMSELILPSSLEGQIQRSMTHYFSSGQGTMVGRRFEVNARRADGTTFPAELAFTVVRADGLPLFTAFVRDVTARKQAEEQILASLIEKEVLLQEIHHRVKNNLQIISSLLSLQARQINHPQIAKALQDGQHRLRSMALIHEKLYRSRDLTCIDMADYVRDLVIPLLQSYGTAPTTVIPKIQVEHVLLGIDLAVPCGLILNELISNTLKHAFPPDWSSRDGGEKEILIELRQDGESRLTLLVGDNGIGLPADFDFGHTMSLGLQLVNILVGQMNGSLDMRNEGGTKFRVTFALPPGRN